MVGTGQADSSWQDSRVGSTAEASTSTYFTVGPGHLTGRLACEEGMGHWSIYDMSLWLPMQDLQLPWVQNSGIRRHSGV